MASASASRARRLAWSLSPLGGGGAASAFRVYGPLDVAAGRHLPALRPALSAPTRFFASKRSWSPSEYWTEPLDPDRWSTEQLYLQSRDPKGRVLPDGCDLDHWLIVMDPPDPNLTGEEIVDSYINTLATVVGSPQKAREMIYSVSTNNYFAFGALISEEQAIILRELPTIQWVHHDKYLEVIKNNDYKATGAIEAANFLATGKLIKLSKQQLIDCNNVNNNGVIDGLMYEAFEYVMRNGGVASADVYPYLARKGKCQNITAELVTISGIRVIVPDCEYELKRAVANMPVSTAIGYDLGWKQYAGGIIRGPNTLLNDCQHAGLLIGFDSLNKTKVWTFKDSQGTADPHGGIKYIARDAYDADGTLGIARYCMFPKKNNCPNEVEEVKSEHDLGIKLESSLFQYSKLTC